MFIKQLSKVLTVMFLTSATLFHLGSVDMARAELPEEKDEDRLMFVQMQAEAFRPQFEQQCSEPQLQQGREPVRSPAVQTREALKDEKAPEDEETARDYFAPGQFQQMEDDEKLSSPSFEQMPAGVTTPEDRAGYGGQIDGVAPPRLEDRPALDLRPRPGVQTPDVRIPEIRTPQLPPAQQPGLDAPRVKPVKPVSPPSAQQPGQARPDTTPSVPGLPPMDSSQDHQDSYSHDRDEYYGGYGDHYHGYDDSYSNDWDYYGDEGYYYGEHHDYYGYRDDYGGYYGDYGHQQHGREGLPYGTVIELDDIMRSGEAETQRGWEGQHEYPIQGDRPWYEKMRDR